MSTRSMIAIRPTANHDFGVYHHYDGYPSSLGITLVRAYNRSFKGIDRMIEALIFDHPAGWSTINGANWTLPPGARIPDENRICVEADCGMTNWQHYRQYYDDHSAIPPQPEEVLQFGHSPRHKNLKLDSRPVCYCHDAEGERRADYSPALMVCNHNAAVCSGRDCDPLFMEWKYVLLTLGVEVWRAGPSKDTYRHYLAGFVNWDSKDAEGHIRAIETDGV